MKTRVLLFAAIAATTFTFVACGNKQAKTNETAAVEQSGAMEIDSLLANAETLADQALFQGRIDYRDEAEKENDQQVAPQFSKR